MNGNYFIFVPAYNVEQTLEKVFYKISSSVLEQSKVVVINDGSKDNTQKVAESIAQKFPQKISIIHFEKNKGYGAVVKKGIEEGLKSNAKFIACLHGDNQYPAEKLEVFFDYLNKHEKIRGKYLALLQGSRHLIKGGARLGKMPFYKRLGGAVLTLIENIVFTEKLTDRHSGFIVYRQEFLKTVDLKKLSSSFDIDLELIAIADAEGYALGELPIKTCYAGEVSNLKVIPYGFRVLKQVWRRLKK